ncbi:RNA dependent RNA polymerase-domain-containing protein [Mycena sp. CBHHK59/15]|nr:RNA dependent RNA polymerase-domain-containing protein [Mycena sp. CBHHK59/15]
MQLFMHNIVFSANEEDLTIAIAQRLHRPPFPLDPPTNFKVEIFRSNRSRGATHRGMGILTLPSSEIGETFLDLFGAGIAVNQRLVMFKRSTRRVNEGLITFVRTRPWVDPETLREEKQMRANLSSTIRLTNFSFGRFCRDGVFSAEKSYGGTVVCDVERRRIVLQLDAPSQRSGPSSNPGLSLGELFGSLQWLSLESPDLPQPEFSVWYSSYRIIAVAAPSESNASENRVFLQSDLPPTFERQKHSFFQSMLDEPPIPERTSTLEDGDHRVTSYTSQGLCLTFVSRQDLDTFLQRCRTLHLPRPLIRDILVEGRDIYSPTKLAALQDFLRSLAFGLAFEVEKAVWGGILEPAEVVAMKQSILDLQQNQQEFGPAAIFRYFLTTLRVPRLDSAPPPSQKSRRRTKRRRVAASPVLDLPGKLAEAVDAYIEELYRPKGRYSPSAGICQAYHLVLTPCTQILEGPLPDQTNSVLRRFENHECFLRVSFQDENRSPPRRDPGLSIDELLERRYKQPLVSGLHVAGRTYEFLGYSMSGLKEYSFIFVAPFTYLGSEMNAQRIRDRLGDFSKIIYRPALLGARWSQAFSTSDPSVTLEPYQIQYRGDKVSTTGSLFTDGCSSISESLSHTVWKSLGNSRKMRAPSAFQFRCGGAKGVLVQDPNLEDDSLIFRPSQTKFEAADIRTLDIAATSARPILVYLNRPLIVLLEHHGTPAEVFFDLQNSAIDEVQRIKDSLQQASKIFSQHGLGGSFRLPSLFNNLFHQLHLEIGPWEDPTVFRHQLIKTTLAYATTHVLREIKHRARILVPGSYTLIGVSDEWDCLEEGEIYATVVDERKSLNLAVTGRVLITRSPQIHPGDAQFVTAVRRRELSHLRNVVVFSCKGSRSLPSQLGGGDLDGDIYNLILDENLFPPKDFTAEPGEYQAVEPKTTSDPCTVSDVADFVIDFIKSDLLGYISHLHLRIADLDPEGPGCADCIVLAEYASHAVDFSKRGVPVDFKKLPRASSQLKPDFLSGEGVNPDTGSAYYPSARVLGKLYRNVPMDDYLPDPYELEQQRTDGWKIQEALTRLGLRSLGLPSLSTVPNEDLLEEMRHIFDEYVDQLMAIARTHTTSKRANAYLSEAELVSGTIQERYTDHRKRREAVAAMNLQTRELAKAIRYEFQSPWYRETQTEDANDEEEDTLEEYDDYDDQWDLAGDEERRRDRFERAWAAWLVAEEALQDDHSSYGPSSFGLIALGTILEVVKEARSSV